MVATEERTRTGTRLGQILLVFGALAVAVAATIGAVQVLSPQPVQTRFGEGEYEFETGPDGADRVRNCDPKTLVTTKSCDDLKILAINADRMPYISHNISQAWLAGSPAVLHRMSAGASDRRDEICDDRVFIRQHRIEGGECDDNAELSVIPEK